MKKKLWQLSWSELLVEQGIGCACGVRHQVPLREVLIQKGALQSVPGLVKKYGGSKPFILADTNTWAAAGQTVAQLLERADVEYASYVFAQQAVGVDALPVGQAVLGFDHSCDVILGVGSGTINDIAKVLGRMTGLPYICVATAPSMDGFASDTSSMVVDGVKVSLPSRCPVAIVGDLSVLQAAPMVLLRAGLGDILAKYVSLFEWRLSHMINDEYYCPEVAGLIKSALQRCVKTAEQLLQREQAAVKDVMEALVLSGVAMSFAQVTRPASGMEHYFSHLWDMRAEVCRSPQVLHGVQVGIGTVQSLRAYDLLKETKIDAKKASAYIRSFSLEKHHAMLREFLGDTAQPLIDLEQKEQKYDVSAHEHRLAKILEQWPQITQALAELPSAAEMRELLQRIGAYTDPSEMGIDCATAKKTLLATKDIRDKYVGSRLLWDLGLLDDFADAMYGS